MAVVGVDFRRHLPILKASFLRLSSTGSGWSLRCNHHRMHAVRRCDAVLEMGRSSCRSLPRKAQTMWMLRFGFS